VNETKKEENMKCSKTVLMCMTVIFVVTIFGSLSFAGSGSPDTPPGVPPYGVAIQSDAAGTKLSGVISIEYGYGGYSCGDTLCYDSRILVRLKKGKETRTFYAEADALPADPALQQGVITNLLKGKILNEFFGGKELTITLTSLGEFKFVPGTVECAINPNPVCSTASCLSDPANDPFDPHCCQAIPACHDEYIMADVTLAVK
jgi:hypothetical protein